MAKSAYCGIGNKARKLKSIYVGIANKARKLKSNYVGIRARARAAGGANLAGFDIGGIVVTSSGYSTTKYMYFSNRAYMNGLWYNSSLSGSSASSLGLDQGYNGYSSFDSYVIGAGGTTQGSGSSSSKKCKAWNSSLSVVTLPDLRIGRGCCDGAYSNYNKTYGFVIGGGTVHGPGGFDVNFKKGGKNVIDIYNTSLVKNSTLTDIGEVADEAPTVDIPNGITTSSLIWAYNSGEILATNSKIRKRGRMGGVMVSIPALVKTSVSVERQNVPSGQSYEHMCCAAGCIAGNRVIFAGGYNTYDWTKGTTNREIICQAETMSINSSGTSSAGGVLPFALMDCQGIEYNGKVYIMGAQYTYSQYSRGYKGKSIIEINSSLTCKQIDLNCTTSYSGAPIGNVYLLSGQNNGIRAYSA